MPPKRRGRPPKQPNGPQRSNKEVFDGGDSSGLSTAMTSRNHVSRGKGRGKAALPDRTAIPGVYQEMLAEALPLQPDVSERPLKRRRTGGHIEFTSSNISREPVEDKGDEDEDLEFEDVLGSDKYDSQSEVESSSSDSDFPRKKIQTAYRDSADESVESDLEWEIADLNLTPQNDEPSGDLELVLKPKPVPQHRVVTPRRRAITKAERGIRLQTHKLHILCLLSYVDRRNHWCNDSEIQASLKPLLSKKMLSLFRPRSDLSQFGQAESLKRGLEEVSKMWRAKFSIVARGLKRSLWAEDEKDIQNTRLASDADACFEKSDFKAAAKELQGSRDVGAQLFCALLRSAGCETRLICSLQPLSFNGGGPVMPRNPPLAVKTERPARDEREVVDSHSSSSPFTAGSNARALPFTARRRLGHPNAADYHIPDISAPIRTPPISRVKTLKESPFPIFWVEVLDQAHQKWLPVDPIVTETVAKRGSFEPPASDRENNMSYVIAFEEEGSARDVTRRYTKAYNAKTRKNRVEFTEGGEKWWKRTMNAYSRGWDNDLDQIEDYELAAFEASEPMPRNIEDFKNHPYYALERHLRKNQILVGTRCGTVAAGRDPSVPGQKKLENVYRRKDVRTVRSADAWYRVGREVKMGELPVKTVAAKGKPDDEDFGVGDIMEERAGTNLYTEDQTKLYEAPPIVNGLVPKNSYGNLDIYVPSMVPSGGVHIPHDEASRAAWILGIDFSDALTGFNFRGRHGTAVLKGIIVASEYREAVEAIVEAFRDERVREEEEMRTLATLRLWKQFLLRLRIKERVDAYKAEGEDDELERIPDVEDDDDEESDEYIDDEGGGFFPE